MPLVTVFRHLLCLQALRVTGVDLRPEAFIIFVDVAIRSSRMLRCSRCGRRHRGGIYDTHRGRLWRSLDLGPWKVYLRADLHRFHCERCQAIVTEAVPWAELGAGFTREFEDLVSFLAQQTNRTAISRLMNIAWVTVGSVITRTVQRRGLPLARRRLYRIGLDEISYRRHHKYLTVIADHLNGDVVWAGEGKSGKTLDAFLDALGEEGRLSISLVSLDMSQAFISKLKERLPHAALAFDPFHVVALGGKAVDDVRRTQVRALKGKPGAKDVKSTRWILLKDPAKLTTEESTKLSALASLNKPLYRAYLLRESLRDLYRLGPADAAEHLNAWLAWASRSRLASFVKLARTIRQHRNGILAAVEHGLSNGRLEGLNNKIRLLSHRAYGFHSAKALIAFIYLCCTQIKLPVPADRRPFVDPCSI